MNVKHLETLFRELLNFISSVPCGPMMNQVYNIPGNTIVPDELVSIINWNSL